MIYVAISVEKLDIHYFCLFTEAIIRNSFI